MKWIWIDNKQDVTAPQFVEFLTEFDVASDAKTTLKISVDYKYVAYVNGAFVGNGQYADLPEHKSVDKFDISCFTQKGKNTLTVIAWHMGQDFSVCRTMTAAVAFEVTSNGKKVAVSSNKTLCRIAPYYASGDLVTPQIGLGYNLDFTVELPKFGNAVVVNTGFVAEPRPVPNLVVSDPIVSTIVAQGVYKLDGGNTTAEKMQNAWLRTLRFADMTGKNRVVCGKILQPLAFFADKSDCDGVFVTVDLGRETCGHLTFDIDVPCECEMYIGWGEHLADLRVRTAVGPRNFASSFKLGVGRTSFTDYLRRVGCRYICIYVNAPSVAINRLSVSEVTYPFKLPRKSFGDELLNKIYQTGRRTLKLCAHEHYEDCPWREQALYGMDSRNQMLFGYGAFKEYRLPRASLRLMALSVGEDGLVPLCAPAEMPITIPSFSAYWLIAFCENVNANYERKFLTEMLPYTEKMLQTFIQHSDDNGVVVFTEPRYWNFHEWSDGLDGGEIFRTEPVPMAYDCALTALVAKALCEVSKLEKMSGRLQLACQYDIAHKRLVASLDNFYDDDGLYASYIRNGQKAGKHCYTQATILFADGAPVERATHMCDVLRNPDGKAVDMTLAALQLKYDALVRYADDRKFCIDEIKRIFGGMVLGGATSFWETANGEADFDDAGSLCHGWSAVACYVLDNYYKTK